jgi:hypothetical protein
MGYSFLNYIIMKIYNKDPVIIQFLDYHRIKYRKDDTKILVDDPETLLNQIVIGNELDLVHRMEDSICQLIISPEGKKYLKIIFSQCTIEMAQLMVKCAIYRRIHVLKIVAGRIDNMDLFMVCAEYYNFPFEFRGFDKYETGRCSTVYRVLKIAIRNGNYVLYNHIASQNKLSSQYTNILSNLKKVLWTTDKFNPNILESLITQYSLQINKDDIVELMKCKNMTVLECIVDLIHNRKIIMTDIQLSGLIDVAKEIYPECVPQLESL